MKVVFICSTLERTGPTNQLLNIISCLKSIVDFKIITLSEEPENSMKQSFLRIGIDVSSADVSGSGLIRSLFVIKSLVSKIKPDIVQSQGIRADFISSLLFRNNLATLRNYPYEDYPAQYGKFKGNVMAFTHLLSLRFFKKRVTVSDSTRKINELNTNLTFDVIYNGVDVKRFSVSDNEKIAFIREKYNLNLDKNILVYTGPLIERKNVSALISSIKGHNDLQLLIVGDGPEMSELRKLDASENVVFVGAVDNVTDFLSVADCFVMLSKSEGFPNSVMEALSVGLPCILSNIPSHQDVHRIIGDSIKLTETDDCFSNFLINDLDSFLKIKNKKEIRELAIENISSEVMANKYLSVYKEMIK